MNHLVNGTTGMDSESHMAPTDHGAYGSGGGTPVSAGGVSVGDGHWVDMSPYAQTTMPDYGSSFGYGLASMSHPLPSETLGASMGGGRMLPPPPQVQQVSQQHPLPPPTHHPHHAQLPNLHPLIMPSNANLPFPSQMIGNPSSYSAPATSMPSLGVPQLKASKIHNTHVQPSPRKTLTDDDRRAMCQFAEDNPTMKQTEIGNQFGVERSTVSKVLRNKEKYLSADDRSSSPHKRTSKAKMVDIEKALSNWVRIQQNKGVVLSPQDIEERFRLFSQNTPDTSSFTGSHLWLEKFKQKHGFGGPKIIRRASETNIPHATGNREGLSGSIIASPSSPHQNHADHSQSPLSANYAKNEDDRDASAGGGNRSSTFMDYTSESGSALSPTPFTFSPDPNGGNFLGAPHGSSNFQRPRSQTFPTLDIELMNQQQGGGGGSTDSMTPKYHVSSTAPSSALESPMSEMLAQPFAIDTSVSSASVVASPHHLRRSSSNSSLAPPRSATAGTPVTAATPTGSSPNSPTQEDARRAAEMLLSFIQQSAGGFVDQTEYMAVVRLTEKLRLNHHLGKAGPSPIITGMGGLTRIPEGDVEVGHAPNTVSMIKMEPTTMSA